LTVNSAPPSGSAAASPNPVTEDAIAPLSFAAYQTQARTTAIYPPETGLLYVALGLCGETGEVAEKIKKMLRDDGGHLGDDRRTAIAAELGDVLWYAANLATELGLDLGAIAQGNLDKLASRQARNQLHGSGDRR
jgi:NTP pyrophosphatase (non-canonical NTP hydrolase)